MLNDDDPNHNPKGKNGVTLEGEVARKKELFLDALRKTLGNIGEALELTGYPRSTVDSWRKKDSKFATAVAGMADVALDYVEGNLMKQIGAGNSASTIFYLKTKGKKRGYTEKQELDVNGMMNINMSYGVAEAKDDGAEDDGDV
jgi:hypothetical protein